MNRGALSLEDHTFAMARLGRHFTEKLARQVNEFFGYPYHFDPVREKQFQNDPRFKGKIEYNGYLAGRLAAAPKYQGPLHEYTCDGCDGCELAPDPRDDTQGGNHGAS